MIDVNQASESVLCASWVVFASGQGVRGEYGTTASAGIGAALEKEISALCREFHNALGVQEVPDGSPVVLFWAARQSARWIITHVMRVPRQPGGRLAYEYFSLALTETDLHKLEGNPLRAMELVGDELREQYAAGLREPICAPLNQSRPLPAVPTAHVPFSQNGTWPDIPQTREALLAYIASGGAAMRSFATWWPSAKPPKPGVFDIVLRSEATRTARPHEVLALATELNQNLTQILPAPPSYDAVGTRYYRTMLQDANEIQERLNEAYFPAALEESPHKWMTRTQKLAGLCQKIADDLPDYATRLPAPLGAEMTNSCTQLADRYGDLARDLQKLRHPNLLHQNREITNTATSGATGKPTDGAKRQTDSAPNISRQGMRLMLVFCSLLALGLLGLGVRILIGEPNKMNATTVAPGTADAKIPDKVANLPGGNEIQRDQQAVALMRARAEREVFRVARALAIKRAKVGRAKPEGLSKNTMETIVKDAVAQSMMQTPHSQIKPAQKQFLFRLATPAIRAKARDGAKAGLR